MHCKCLCNVFEKFPSLSNDARPCEILTFMKLDGYPSEFEGNDYFLRVGGYPHQIFDKCLFVQEWGVPTPIC